MNPAFANAKIPPEPVITLNAPTIPSMNPTTFCATINPPIAATTPDIIGLNGSSILSKPSRTSDINSKAVAQVEITTCPAHESKKALIALIISPAIVAPKSNNKAAISPILLMNS